MFRTLSVALFVAFVLTVLLVMDVLIHKEGERDTAIEEIFFFRGNRTVISSRKLLQSADDGVMNRIGMGCSKDDIVIYQGQVEFLCTHTVQITNMCASYYNIANIRLHCGWFSSASLINLSVS